MTEGVSHQEAADYFNRFVEAFESFDGRKVGALFAVPGVALTKDNAVTGFAEQSDVEAYYQAALDHYAGQGCVSARYFDLQTDEIGPMATAATVTWDLLTADGTILSRWRQSYFLKRDEGQPKAFASAFVAV